MGFGDELMITGQARALQQKKDLPVVVLDRHGHIRTEHMMWWQNPRIARKWDRVSPVHQITNGPSARPYIEAKTDMRWIWKPYKPEPGEFYFYEEEQEFAKSMPRNVVVLEPNYKDKASPNKDWGRTKWQHLADLLTREGIDLIQMGAPGTPMLQGVRFFKTPTIRFAAAALAGALTAVLPEGGMHHVAAAMGVPAVVIYGGYISPAQTGYDLHRNLFTGGEACGMRWVCAHCKKAMDAITPEEVLVNTMEVIHARVSGV